MFRGFLLLLVAALMVGCGGNKPLVDKPTFWRTIEGTITYGERTSLNSGAVLQVWLLGTERLGKPSETVVSSTISNPGQVPISFTLDYDPAWIIADHFYTIMIATARRRSTKSMASRWRSTPAICSSGKGTVSSENARRATRKKPR